MINVAINGFGRIGRRIFRLLQDHKNIQVVAINDLAGAKTLSHLLKYDSIHGVFQGEISYDSNHIIVNNAAIALQGERYIESINWKPYKVDFVIEATGKFRTLETLNLHITNGASRVILSAPPIDDSIKTIVLGVNDHVLGSNDIIVSNASVNVTFSVTPPAVSITKTSNSTAVETNDSVVFNITISNSGANNEYAIFRLYMTPAGDHLLIYPQVAYSTLDEAKNNVLLEAPELDLAHLDQIRSEFSKLDVGSETKLAFQRIILMEWLRISH